MAHPPLLAPSILAAPHTHLAAGLQKVLTAPVSWLHLDIMDGHFVPNISFGPQVVSELRTQDSRLYFDTHLMLSRPQDFIVAFADAGADNITVHVEADHDVAATLSKIREVGCHAGLALNPGTRPSALEPYLDQVDLVLVMTVWPGFGGQSFIEDTLISVETLHRWRTERTLPFRLEVDGGIDHKTGPRCRAAGADTFVAGSAFFKAPDVLAFTKRLQG